MQEKQMKNQFKVGVVGIGRMGLMQIEYILLDPRWQIVGVVDSSKLAYARFQQRYHNYGIPFFSNVVTMLETEEMDAIIVSSTASFHVSITKSILEKGFSGAILIEKPISTSVIEAKSLLKAMSKTNLKSKLGVDYGRRCSSMYCEIDNLINSGKLGNLLEIKVKLPGKKISMNGSHFIDLAIFLTHSQPSQVFANFSNVSTLDHRGSYYFDPEGYLKVIFQNQTIFELDTRANNNQNEKGINILCEKGNIFIDSHELDLKIDAPTVQTKQITSDKRDQSLNWFKNTLEALILNNIARCNPCTVEESILSLEVIVAAFVSHQRGMNCVNIPLENNLESEILRIA